MLQKAKAAFRRLRCCKKQRPPSGGSDAAKSKGRLPAAPMLQKAKAAFRRLRCCKKQRPPSGGSDVAKSKGRLPAAPMLQKAKAAFRRPFASRRCIPQTRSARQSVSEKLTSTRAL